MTQAADVDAALTRVVREEGGRMLALLAARLGDLDRAEDALQDAYSRAARAWSTSGAPDNPAAWVFTVARNAGVDRWRRDQAARRRLAAEAPLLASDVAAPADAELSGAAADQSAVAEYAHVGDEQLRLLLLCCHPALHRDAQVALTLRLAGGLTTAEIAAALVTSEATVAQRIFRAKRKIRDARIPLTIPADLSERAQLLTTVLGLIFNEAYLARTEATGTLTRRDLADQAIRLTAAAADALPDEPELAGLLALELFHRSRDAARTDADGRLVVLAHQDRSAWDRADIARGHRVLAHALAARRLGPWQVQAMIAAEHTSGDPDWTRILRYYDTLIAMEPGPVAALGRAVVVAEVDGAQAGLEAVEAIGGLETYHLFHAARGHLLGHLGRAGESAAAWRQARDLARNPAEVAFASDRAAASGTTVSERGT